MFPGVLGGPRFQEEMTLSHTVLPLAHSATATTASLLFLEPSGHTPASSPGPDRSFSRYQRESFPYLLDLFTQMSPPN